ncbi:hypothetical protein jhhlp_002243 [Lomentospora prolificans]|uniref:C2H2-type domain-containing protein n=1 Tax=Lomentospora prolificans TaxID=41688 RepID=A0A2N3NDJ4_9PEZI|nr:hypothetical protein jhhlp_002243 [Lomentospora prolificans]
MTLTLDTNQRYGQLNFDPSYTSSASPPQFSDPWSSAPAPGAGSSLYVGNNHNTQHHQNLNPEMGMNCMPRQHTARASTSSVSSSASYASMPVPATSAAQDLLGLNRLPNVTAAQYGEGSYSSSSPVHAHYPPSNSPYDNLAYTQNSMRSTFALPPGTDATRRFSQPGLEHSDRRRYPDAMDASHGLLSMSQETPRNIYGPRGQRGSADSYGFPSTHSTNSSISSTSNFSSYRESSLSDYSTMGSDLDLSRTRALPRPQNLMTSQVPPAPQSLMSQFSSKVSSSTQKKHKCKVCDKRFTRPSSLQTHMYSHTGEKPYACEVEGCGKHFSVVSNLRRHQKVHKGEARSEAGSEDHQSE